MNTLTMPPVQAIRALGNPSTDPVWQVYAGLSLLSAGASAYHGYKRNDSVGWALWWGFWGGVFPIVTPAIALAQGFGEPEHR
jgi:hypothetical protein